MNFKIAITALALTFSAVQTANATDWSGTYIGGQVGWHSLNLDASATDGTDSVSESIKENGFAGGIYAGYNFQSGSMVYGLEGGLDFNNASKDYQAVDGADTAELSISQKVSGSIKARLGIAQDNFLIYGVAGISFSKLTADYDITFNGDNFKGSASESLTGLVLGAGVEYQMSESMVLRVAYDYTSYGDLDLGSGAETATIETATHDIKVGVSFKF